MINIIIQSTAIWLRMSFQFVLSDIAASDLSIQFKLSKREF